MKGNYARTAILMGIFLLPLSGLAEESPSMALLEFLAEDDVEDSLLERTESIKQESSEQNLMDADEAASSDIGEEG